MDNDTQTYNFYLTNKQTQIRYKIIGNVSDKDYKRLTKYSKYAEDLSQTKFIDSKISFKFDWSREKPAKFDYDIPPDEIISDFILKVRPFILIKEPTYFYSICNILSKNFDDEKLNIVINNFRDYYSGRHFQKQVKFQINKVVINSEKTLHDWLNAYIYHKDEKNMIDLRNCTKIFFQ